MLDEQPPADAGNGTENQTENTGTQAPQDAAPAPRKRAPRKSAAKKAAATQPDATAPGEAQDAPQDEQPPEQQREEESSPPPAKKASTRRTRKAPAAARADQDAAAESGSDAKVTAEPGPESGTESAAEPAAKPAKKTAAKRTAKKASAKRAAGDQPTDAGSEDGAVGEADDVADAARSGGPTALLFQPPEAPPPPRRRAARKTTKAKSGPTEIDESPDVTDAAEPAAEDAPETAVDAGAQREDTDAAAAEGDADSSDDVEGEGEGGPRRRRRRGGRRRRKGSGEANADQQSDDDSDEQADEAAADEGSQGDAEQGEGSGTSRRRRRRRRSGEGDGDSNDDPEGTVTRVRKSRSAEDEITSFSGSTRLEAKKQRRREGREAGRRRAPIISEAEFLARREAVDRTMVIRQRKDLTQIAVLEDKVLVEHYVARESQTSLIGNVYLGRVQNVLPSMEAAFIDIGRGRNAVLYAGEVNWEALGAKEGNQRKIEQVLKPGQAVLVQVTKDPIGHKGARLTSQISLPGRFLVYVPGGSTSGISRKLPDNERNRLKTLLKEIVPETAGVIVRTAAEGASEDELTRDVERLKALWSEIESKVENGNAPQMLYVEPDLTLKVVRDLFTEDFAKLVVSGEEAWDMVEQYVHQIAPDLADRLEKHDDSDGDAFAEYRIDEQIAKALDRKVWLPSGGSLVIDRTEAMTVVDVNTGKFTGSGGNLEETVTKNNLEAAEEIVRQLRLRDIGGIIVIDFIDMVLENNRDLVLRRLIECLGRDRTRHQVAEVTSLGLVQMTRKRIGTGLLEAFSEPCEHCQGRGLHLHQEPVDQKRKQTDEEPRRNRRNRGRGRSEEQQDDDAKPDADVKPLRRPTPAEFAAMAGAEAQAAEAAEVAEAAEGADAAEAVEAAAPEQPVQVEAPEQEPRQDEPAQAPAAEEAEEQSADRPSAEEQPVPEEQPADEPALAAPPAAPRIVTSVRRIGARRPAGPPAAGSASTAVATAPDDQP